jgi:hypothetical protein
VVLCTFMSINNHLSTDYYQENIHFDLNKQKKMSGLRFELMDFRFRTSFTYELVDQEIKKIGYHKFTWQKTVC